MNKKSLVLVCFDIDDTLIDSNSMLLLSEKELEGAWFARPETWIKLANDLKIIADRHNVEVKFGIITNKGFFDVACAEVAKKLYVLLCSLQGQYQRNDNGFSCLSCLVQYGKSGELAYTYQYNDLLTDVDIAVDQADLQNQTTFMILPKAENLRDVDKCAQNKAIVASRLKSIYEASQVFLLDDLSANINAMNQSGHVGLSVEKIKFASSHDRDVIISDLFTNIKQEFANKLAMLFKGHKDLSDLGLIDIQERKTKITDAESLRSYGIFALIRDCGPIFDQRENSPRISKKNS